MTVAMHQMLILENDKQTQNALRLMFEEGGFRVEVCDVSRLVTSSSRVHRCDVLVVDLPPAEQGGIGLVQAIRARSSVPILVLSGRAGEAERVAALEQGADDYVVKPFSPPELLARVRAILRRHVRGELPMGRLQLGTVSIDLGLRSAHRSDGSPVRLTPVEHRILETLVRHADRIVAHATLLREVWGPRQGDSQVLRVNVGNLRRKLEEDPRYPKFIVTEAGIGYRLVLARVVSRTGGRSGPTAALMVSDRSPAGSPPPPQ